MIPRFARQALRPLAALVAAASLSTAAWGQDADVAKAQAWAKQHAPKLPAEVIAGAAKEGKVMLYCLNSSCPPELVSAFSKTFPFIKVETYRASGGALAERLTSEVRANRAIADIWMNSSPAVADRFAKEGLLANYTPVTGELVPAKWRHDGYWYGIGLLHMGIAWNPEKVTPQEAAWLDKVSSWDQVANPAFKGRSAMAHVRAGGTAHIAYAYFREKLGANFLDKLNDALAPVIYQSSNPVGERLVAGEYAFIPHTPTDIGSLATYFKRGAPVRWRYPEPALALPYLASIAANAPHPNAARLFMTWSSSLEGQSAWVNITGLAPMRPDVKDNREFTKTDWYRAPKTYWDVDWARIDQEMPAMTADFKRVFNK
ncbi:MAG TPA: extracellular solute-binding protein [Usitatibacter sp.]|nr:extracellular solute-binding protein [Usitatibacter sp.]